MPSDDQPRLNPVEDEFDVSLPQPPPQRSLPREKVSAELGSVIVKTFALSIGACFITVFIHILRDQEINASLELFKTVSAVMSGPLGFVLGFYFRERDKKS